MNVSLRKYKNKIIDNKAAECSSSFQTGFVWMRSHEDDANEIKIIRTKKFDMKPMYPEDACVQMELLGHDFYRIHQRRDRGCQCCL